MRKIVQDANAFFNCALRAKYFAFAIQFGTFNKFCAARQVCAITAQLVAANR
jgi:hypothetical protein